jgi:hypothetical protein
MERDYRGEIEAILSRHSRAGEDLSGSTRGRRRPPPGPINHPADILSFAIRRAASSLWSRHLVEQYSARSRRLENSHEQTVQTSLYFLRGRPLLRGFGGSWAAREGPPGVSGEPSTRWITSPVLDTLMVILPGQPARSQQALSAASRPPAPITSP